MNSQITGARTEVVVVVGCPPTWQRFRLNSVADLGAPNIWRLEGGGDVVLRPQCCQPRSGGAVVVGGGRPPPPNVVHFTKDIAA